MRRCFHHIPPQGQLENQNSTPSVAGVSGAPLTIAYRYRPFSDCFLPKLDLDLAGSAFSSRSVSWLLDLPRKMLGVGLAFVGVYSEVVDGLDAIVMLSGRSRAMLPPP